MTLPYGFTRITFYSGKSVSVWLIFKHSLILNALFLPLNDSSSFQQATTLLLLPMPFYLVLLCRMWRLKGIK